jgi:hypothetical protein
MFSYVFFKEIVNIFFVRDTRPVTQRLIPAYMFRLRDPVPWSLRYPV